MRLLVCGSRTWMDRESIEREIVRFGVPLTVIHGDAPGADRLAASFASAIWLDVIPFPANWQRDGKAAGPIRNARMLREGKPDRGLAFGALWRRHTGPFDPLFKAVTGAREEWRATGTGDMVRRMLDARLPVRWVATVDALALDLAEMPGPPA